MYTYIVSLSDGNQQYQYEVKAQTEQQAFIMSHTEHKQKETAIIKSIAWILNTQDIPL